ncbi:MAG: CapA family protein [Alistipes finegoldii]
MFAHLHRRFRAADLVIVNLETTLTRTDRYTGYPCFRSPAALADALRDAGVDVAVLANNHCCDGGGAGCIRPSRNFGGAASGIRAYLRTVSTVRPTIRFGSNTAACASHCSTTPTAPTESPCRRACG